MIYEYCIPKRTNVWIIKLIRTDLIHGPPYMYVPASFYNLLKFCTWCPALKG